MSSDGAVADDNMTTNGVHYDDEQPSQHQAMSSLLSNVSADDDFSEPSSPDPLNYQQFIQSFLKSTGATEILTVAMLLGFGIGSVVGVIPASLGDRYAHIDHGFGYHSDSNATSCMDYSHMSTKPIECQEGSDDAQAAAAWSNFGLNLLTLIFCPVVGAASDFHGRRPCILLGLSLSCIPAVMYLVVLLVPTLDPVWYYASYSLLGVVNFISLMFAAMSDVVEAKYRTPGYGMLMAVFFGSFSIAPAIAVGFQDPIHVAVFSLFFIFASFLYATFFLPETLRSHHLRRHNDLSSDATVRQPVVAHGDSGPALGFCDTVCQWSVWLSAKITRPVRDAAIINRDWTIRQIAIGSFFSSMVHASDVTLIVYYIEDHLNVHQKDIASLFFVLGLAGIVIQAGLEPLIRLLGEKGLLITAFCCGTLHNFLYGIAQSKSTIYIAFIVSQVTKTNMPILSSMASKHVSPNEQGRVQGALFATNAIASAIGPMVLVYFYHLTKDKHPGAMFLCASGLYSIGTIVVSLTNVKEIEDDSVSDSTSGADRRQSNINDNEYICPATSLEQPLLSSE